jgi:deoxyribodipyrimidine photolyase-like uncharacterized protein
MHADDVVQVADSARLNQPDRLRHQVRVLQPLIELKEIFIQFKYHIQKTRAVRSSRRFVSEGLSINAGKQTRVTSGAPPSLREMTIPKRVCNTMLFSNEQ